MVNHKGNVQNLIPPISLNRPASHQRQSKVECRAEKKIRLKLISFFCDELEDLDLLGGETWGGLVFSDLALTFNFEALISPDSPEVDAVSTSPFSSSVSCFCPSRLFHPSGLICSGHRL